ncbi:VOC family protein [Fimbriimonas ginsengisoli]|uniref:27 kDa antigen Cfp30B n=1 Tax=Fimbriimonas ginsengisoli Gsoil 348 TaxID=661478 RepID=A0A068NSC5_FIMGI|nr:VOC family protein [Fimbriimonas ginsengisoli]AIE86252.1 27 kDa antigen Cfp30B [Fimbriimonas ginsengisoli Gsoil 348]
MAENNANENVLNNGRTFVWHEVYGASSQASIDFYTSALDFGFTEMEMGSMGTYKMLTRNGIPVCGVLGTTEMEQIKDAPPHWATYLSVDDVDARLTKCQELGATVVVPAMDVPTVGRMALIMDPQGAHIWLFKGAPQE